MSHRGDTCWIFQKTRFDPGDGRNKTFKVQLAGGYEGIPEVLVMNLVLYTVIILLFSWIRRGAWNYGRIALLSRINRTPKVTTLLYGGLNELNVIGADTANGQRRLSTKSQESVHSDDSSVHHALSVSDKGFCSWVLSLFHLTDQHLLAKCGSDAVQYANFQRTLIVYLAVICILSVSVILPINFQGNYVGARQKFGHTTISNISPQDDSLWVHCLFTLLYTAIAAYFMHRFSVQFKVDKAQQDDEHLSTAIMITNIPRAYAGKADAIRDFFSQAYPELRIVDVQFAFDIADLVVANRYRKTAEGAVRMIQSSGENPVIRPYLCGRVCCCNACGGQVPARDFYERETQKYTTQCLELRQRMDQNPLGIAFVTFDTQDDALRVAHDFRRLPLIGRLKNAMSIPRTLVNQQLKVYQWHVKIAPDPDNIYWENLSTKHRIWRQIFLNLGVFVLLFFLTTPSMAWNLWLKIGLKLQTPTLESNPNPIISDGIPILMLLLFAALLHPIIYYAEYYGFTHWTKSSENLSVMRKTFVFLLFMTLILPSFGLMSGPDFLKYIFTPDANFTVRWNCVFLPDNGAFFVNYVTSSTFVGTAMEFLRVSQLCWYVFLICVSRSEFEHSYVKQMSVYDFPFGSNYAWMLAIFAIVNVYSLICPLITPFGLMYFVMKYLADRYNLYFAYAPSRISASIHKAAVSFVLISCCLAQLTLFFFIFIRSEKTFHAKAIFVLCSLAVTLFVFFGHVLFGWFSGLEKPVYKQFLDDDNEQDAQITTDSDHAAIVREQDSSVHPAMHRENRTAADMQFASPFDARNWIQKEIDVAAVEGVGQGSQASVGPRSYGTLNE